MLGHPAKLELAAHAENLAHGCGICADLARHIASCETCAAEVKAITASLDFLSSAPAMNPSAESTAQLLLAARKERKTQRGHRSGLRTVYTAAKALACAAGIVLLASVTFRSALDGGVSAPGTPAPRPQVVATANPSAEEIRETASKIQSLALAVRTRSDSSQSLWERQHRRVVLALDADRAAALAALESNPGCARASRLASANLMREAQALKTLYVERGL